MLYKQCIDSRKLLSDASEALLSFKNGGIVRSHMNDEFHPSSLGLQHVSEKTPSSPTSPQQPLNRRGVPARIRKKNKLFFDDDVVSSVVPKSMLKTTRVKSNNKKTKKPKEPEPLPTTPVTSKLENSDRKLGQKIGIKLRNLLKLPKAYKWLCYEWFYSNIDQVLLGGENDFLVCLKETFPQLKTYNLSRVEWCKMRRLMGKPRRCSQAFFQEERRELERKRMKIRQLQQRKPMDLTTCKDLPPEIPLQLVIGTKVTARLRSPQDGLFLGSVDALDPSNNTYRITFERPGIGTHSIPDCEVLSNEPVETISVMSMLQALRPNVKPPSEQVRQSSSVSNSCDLSSGFHIATLESIVQLSKILDIKKSKVEELRKMNTEAENKQCFQQRLTDDFTKSYASVVVELEQINQHLQQILSSVNLHCQKVSPEFSVVTNMLTPNAIREQSLTDAREIVDHCKAAVKNNQLIDLIVELTALIIQVRSLSESERSNFEVEVLSTSMNCIKKKLSPLNQTLFENLVEVHLRHIQSGLCGDIGPYSGFLSNNMISNQ